MGIKDGLLSGGSAGGNTFFHHPRKKRADGSECAPAGAELSIQLVFRNVTFDYAFPLSGKTISGGTILELSVDGRSMYSFEGTATGAFTIYYPDGNSWGGHGVVATVTLEDIDGDGRFSVMLPFSGRLNFGYNVKSNEFEVPAANRNQVLTTITKLPDYIETLTSIQSLFEGCAALTSVPDMPWTGNVTNMTKLFSGCTALLEIPELDTSSCTNYNGMFACCTQITEAPLINTAAATSLSYLYYKCSNLTSVPNLNTSRVTNFSCMFQQCTSLATIPALDMSAGTNFYRTFAWCSNLESTPLLDTSNATTLQGFMTGCGKVEAINLTSTAKVTSFESAWNNCATLTVVPDYLSFESATNVSFAFQGCTSLISSPSFSFPKCTSFYGMYNGDINLESVGVMDTPRASSMRQTFQDCKKLTSSPLRNTSTVTTFYSCFTNTTSLTDYTPLDLSSATDIDYMFNGTSYGYLPYFNTSSCTHFIRPYGNFVTLEGVDVSAYTGTLLTIESNRATSIGSIDGAQCNIRLNTPYITHDSLVGIIDHLTDMTASPKILYLSQANINKLSAGEIAVANGKGWTLQVP